MAEVRASVASFLQREGANDGGDYYVKVFLTPATPEAEPEWVMVRFTRYTAQRVALVNEYNVGDELYSPYYGYDLYPWGDSCVTRLSFQYYVDPFYGRRSYYYPRHGYVGGYHPRDRDRGRDHDGRPGNRPARPPTHVNPNGSNPPRSPHYAGGDRWNRPPTGGDDNNHRPRQWSRPDRPSGGGRPDSPRRGPEGVAGDHPRRQGNPGSRGPDRPAIGPAPTASGGPNRSEARMNPQPARVAPSNSARPAPSYQPSRAPSGSFPAPARSAPSSSSDRGGGEGRRESLR